MPEVYDPLLATTAAVCRTKLAKEIRPEQVYEQKVATASEGSKVKADRLFILVSPAGTPTVEPKSTAKDLITYPVLVMIGQPSNNDHERDKQRFLRVIRIVRRAFVFQRRPEVSGGGVDVWSCELQLDPAFSAPSFFTAGFDISAMILNFKSDEFTNIVDGDDDGIPGVAP